MGRVKKESVPGAVRDDSGFTQELSCCARLFLQPCWEFACCSSLTCIPLPVLTGNIGQIEARLRCLASFVEASSVCRIGVLWRNKSEQVMNASGTLV